MTHPPQPDSDPTAREAHATGRSRTWPETAWLILVTAALTLHVGDFALVDPDEGRNAAIALEMLTSRDYLIPKLNEVPYLDKPPLLFAMEGFAMKVLGRSELAVRLPSLLFAIATVAITVWFAAHLFGRSSAWIAGTVCATAPMTIIMARVAIFDSMLSFFIVFALMAFYRSLEPRASKWPYWNVFAWAAMALGVMTKGPVALLLPLMVAAPYAIWRRRPLAIWHIAGLAAFLLMIVPWLMATESRMPGFLRYALVTETWQRVTTETLHRDGPIWYFLPYLLAGFFPWIIVVLVSGWRMRKASPVDRGPLIFIVLWVVLPLIFFSLSNSKRPQYILPLIPAIALLVAWIWSGERAPVRGVRVAALSLILFGGAVLFVSTQPWPGRAEDFSAAGRTPLMIVGILAILSGVLSWLSAKHRRLAVVALSFPLMMFIPLAAPLLAAVTDSRSSLALASKLRPHLNNDTVLVGVDTYIPSLTFYLGKSIRLSTSTAEPLRSNYVLHAYDTLATGSPTLRPGGWWKEAALACAEPLILLLRPQDKTERSFLTAAGLPLLYQDRRVVAMGPCDANLPMLQDGDAAR